MNNILIKPIAYIKTPFFEKFGIPRQSKRAKLVKGEIIFIDKYNNPDYIRNIDNFSHLWIIFGFNKNKENISPLVRPPRLGGNEKVGVFASRASFRPNGLGLSSVKLEKVNISSNQVSLIVSGVDILDNSPIYDIKPYLPSTDKIDDATGGYSDKFINYKLNVIFPSKLKQKIDSKYIEEITECLAEDPRPSYQNDNREYGMRYYDYNVKFSVEDDTLTVIDIEKIIKTTL